MAKKNCLVALRISSRTRDDLEELMVIKGENKLSDILRDAIDEYLINHLPKMDVDVSAKAREITVKLNERAFILLHRLIKRGIITSLGEGIREAIPPYCIRKVDEYNETEGAVLMDERVSNRTEWEPGKNIFDGKG